MASVVNRLRELATIDIFKDGSKDATFVGRPFYLDFSTLRLLSNDKWKYNVNGIPSGAFLLCVYEGETDVHEAILVRTLGPTRLPTDDDVVAAMVDFYKEDLPTQVPPSRLDSYTRAEFQFSGLECRVLGTFYRDEYDVTRFAGDIDNYYAPNNYRVYKPTGRVLEYIVNFREDGVPGGRSDVRIGAVRYSSSRSHSKEDDVPVYVSPADFLGKRTALFGMTRTGKSNTVKKIIQATVKLSGTSLLNGSPVQPVGQIIFDVNGEYANENQQDAGTAIFAQYPDDVTRYSVLSKDGFRVMKVNFYNEIQAGFSLLASLLSEDTSDYTRAFCNITWEEPDSSDFSAKTRYQRRVAAYQCCLYQAGFSPLPGMSVKFSSSSGIRDSGIPGLAGVEPTNGLSLDDAVAWFTAAWGAYRTADSPFESYRRSNNGRDWADEDLQTLMRVLTRKSRPGGTANESGYRKLIPARDLHTPTVQQPFEDEIVNLLRLGKIVIVDLSQGDPAIQRIYSDRICRTLFADGMAKFIANDLPNYIQLYFEEAHNLFPRKDDRDLTLIYNRLAKEGQKLNLGLIYATQEVSSVSPPILKNTQNWFISHLNNMDELREIQKYYDFEDFTESLRRTIDKGFIRMKTDSNTFVVPVQVDRFTVAADR